MPAGFDRGSKARHGNRESGNHVRRECCAVRLQGEQNRDRRANARGAGRIGAAAAKAGNRGGAADRKPRCGSAGGGRASIATPGACATPGGCAGARACGVSRRFSIRRACRVLSRGNCVRRSPARRSRGRGTAVSRRRDGSRKFACRGCRDPAIGARGSAGARPRRGACTGARRSAGFRRGPAS